MKKASDYLQAIPSKTLLGAAVAGLAVLALALAGRAAFTRNLVGPREGTTIYLPMQSWDPYSLTFEPVGDGFNFVTSITHAGDDRLFIGQRTGEIFVLYPDGSQSLLLDLSDSVVVDGAEYGFYDIAFHPDFAQNGLFFVTYSGRIDDAVNVILSRYEYRSDTKAVDPLSRTDIMRIPQFSMFHKGGGLDFDYQTNWLYLGVGDDHVLTNAQDVQSPKGKVIRIAVDDVAPDVTGNVEGQAQVEVWSLGLRNPWRIDVDEPSGQIYIADVSETDEEEVNVGPIGVDGTNFGWPCRQGPIAYEPGNGVPACQTNLDLTDPLFAYNHGDGRCAIIGGLVYRPNSNPDDGRYIFGDLCTRDIFALGTGGTDANPSFSLGVVSNRVLVTLGKDSQGNLFAGDGSEAGPIYKLSFPEAIEPTPEPSK